jgi:hypothetical protein
MAAESTEPISGNRANWIPGAVNPTNRVGLSVLFGLATAVAALIAIYGSRPCGGLPALAVCGFPAAVAVGLATALELVTALALALGVYYISIVGVGVDDSGIVLAARRRRSCIPWGEVDVDPAPRKSGRIRFRVPPRDVRSLNRRFYDMTLEQARMILAHPGCPRRPSFDRLREAIGT